jgi:UbiD family decarboxylase
MRFDSLKQFVGEVDARGDVAHFEGVSLDLEIGALTEVCAEQEGPLLLFGEFDGLAPDYKVATNVFNTTPRFAYAHGLDAEAHPIDVLREWRGRLAAASFVAPETVTDGRLLENTIEEDIDIRRFPAPKWHPLDGGDYIGTCDVGVILDPESGWVNVGIYRCAVQGPTELSVWIIGSKHGRMIAEKYWRRGESCPVALVLGADPLTWSAAASPQPEGVSEYSYAGALHEAPVQVVATPEFGLPVPAGAELVFEGTIPDPAEKSVEEGPFGEWPGYYSHQGRECVIQVRRIMHADDPIVFGVPRMRPLGSTLGFPAFAAGMWDNLERVGITGVTGVWGFCGTLMIVLSIRQRYAGHARQALLAAAGMRTFASMFRYYVAVDDDIDPPNLEEVIWAMCTRVDPAESVDVVRGVTTSGLDPRIPPSALAAGELVMGRMLIDACKPYAWRESFPQTNRFDTESRRAAVSKWQSVLLPFGIVKD